MKGIIVGDSENGEIEGGWVGCTTFVGNNVGMAVVFVSAVTHSFLAQQRNNKQILINIPGVLFIIVK